MQTFSIFFIILAKNNHFFSFCEKFFAGFQFISRIKRLKVNAFFYNFAASKFNYMPEKQQLKNSFYWHNK